ncbi:hypothetical protein SERIO_v1c10920 [Spiroplasma eriocheiris]|uniref:Uncharacterized protein n=2 Tax=Spiroplasma eriocheiris TaxID=315358 RepID=A0A0H3XJ83_9MOLU|nr:hypothetical protein SPE_1095 [Spiroplasma eriocheiris CCTCC M 207170]AKM54645.1 hypothetical protein SERIO_v1c10920 [Spiroplasma eriocheiris]
MPGSFIKDDIFALEDNLFIRLSASHPSLTKLTSTINFCNQQLFLTHFLATATNPPTVERYDLSFDELVLSFSDFQAIIMVGFHENCSFANLINNFKTHSLKEQFSSTEVTIKNDFFSEKGKLLTLKFRKKYYNKIESYQIKYQKYLISAQKLISYLLVFVSLLRYQGMKKLLPVNFYQYFIKDLLNI